MAEYTYSVVIPHYNSPKLLARMLKSIPERNDIQIIVVDDCSPKEAQDELMQLQHKGLEVVLQPENHGAGYARNVGLGKIKGEWCIFVDADDFFAVNTFEVFDKEISIDYDYLMFCTSYYNPNNGQVSDAIGNVSNESNLMFLSNPCKETFRRIKLKSTVCYNKLVKSSFIKDNNIFFEAVPVNNDVLYAYMVSLYAKNMKIIKDALYIKELVNTSITGKKRNIEREFLFYIQAQKRNGLFDLLNFRKYPYYRADILYIPFLLKKRGLLDTIRFFNYRSNHITEVNEARSYYKRFFNGLTLEELDGRIQMCKY